MTKPANLFEKLTINKELSLGLLVCCGGFEDRALTFAKRLRKVGATADSIAILHYESQREDNERHYERLQALLKGISPKDVEPVHVDASKPVISYEHIRERILEESASLGIRKVTVDVSAMTHMWALGVIHCCVAEGFDVDVVYTEANRYFPLRKDAKPLRDAWHDKDYEKAEEFLQSAALMAVHILPDFAGNFRPGHPNCLVVFAGYEPNRLEGLVDSYAPAALVVLYGMSPRPEHKWRTELSKTLHEKMFANWPRREDVCSTLSPEKALEKLEEIFCVVGHKYDLAISPHCSKMQGVASYVFWRRHPETQLIFTSPVRFKPSQYSKGEKDVYIYRLSAALREGIGRGTGSGKAPARGGVRRGAGSGFKY